MAHTAFHSSYLSSHFSRPSPSPATSPSTVSPPSSTESRSSYSLSIDSSKSSTGSESLTSANITPCTSDDALPDHGMHNSNHKPAVVVKKSSLTLGRPGLRHFPSIASFRSSRSSHTHTRTHCQSKNMEPSSESEGEESDIEAFADAPVEGAPSIIGNGSSWRGISGATREKSGGSISITSKSSHKSRFAGSLRSKASFSLFKFGNSRRERTTTEESGRSLNSITWSDGSKADTDTEFGDNTMPVLASSRARPASLVIDLANVSTLVAELKADSIHSTFEPDHVNSLGLSISRPGNVSVGVGASNSGIHRGEVRATTPMELHHSSGISRFNPLPTIAASPPLPTPTYPTNPSLHFQLQLPLAPDTPTSPQEFFTPMTTFSPFPQSTSHFPKPPSRLLSPIPSTSSSSLATRSPVPVNPTHLLSLDQALHQLSFTSPPVSETHTPSMGLGTDPHTDDADALRDSPTDATTSFDLSIFSPRVHRAPSLNPLEAESSLPVSPLELPAPPTSIHAALDAVAAGGVATQVKWSIPVLPRNAVCSPTVELAEHDSEDQVGDHPGSVPARTKSLVTSVIEGMATRSASRPPERMDVHQLERVDDRQGNSKSNAYQRPTVNNHSHTSTPSGLPPRPSSTVRSPIPGLPASSTSTPGTGMPMSTPTYRPPPPPPSASSTPPIRPASISTNSLPTHPSTTPRSSPRPNLFTHSSLLLRPTNSPTPTPPSLIASPKSLGQPYPPGYVPRPQPRPPSPGIGFEVGMIGVRRARSMTATRGFGRGCTHGGLSSSPRGSPSPGPTSSASLGGLHKLVANEPNCVGSSSVTASGPALQRPSHVPLPACDCTPPTDNVYAQSSGDGAGADVRRRASARSVGRGSRFGPVSALGFGFTPTPSHTPRGRPGVRGDSRVFSEGAAYPARRAEGIEMIRVDTPGTFGLAGEQVLMREGENPYFAM